MKPSLKSVGAFPLNSVSLDGPSGVLWPYSPSAAVSQMQGEVHQAAQVSTTACLQQRGRGQQEREGAAGRQLDLSAVRFLC